MNINEQKLEYNGISIAVADITEAGIAYLLQYGWAKSLQDSVAGRKKALLEGDPEANPPVGPMAEDEVEAALQEIMAKRANAIVAGEVGVRTGGPRVTKLERVMRNVAAEIIKAAAAKGNKKLPKGEAYQALISAYVAKNEASVKAEAERRMATTDVDLAELGL